jgi:hypothetical protein
VSQDTVNDARIWIYPWGVLQEHNVNTMGGAAAFILSYAHCSIICQ